MKEYIVIHSLDDIQEQKVNVEGLGFMKLNPIVKYSLLSLRLYLILMGALVLYRVVHEIGII